MPRNIKKTNNEARLTSYERGLFSYYKRGQWNAKTGEYTPNLQQRNVYGNNSNKLGRMYRPMSLFRTTTRDLKTGEVTIPKTSVTTKNGYSMNVNQTINGGYNMRGKVALNESFRGQPGVTRVKHEYSSELKTSKSWQATPSNREPISLKPSRIKAGTERKNGDQYFTTYVDDPLSTVAMQLKIAAYLLEKNLDYWKNALAYRALNIFQKSFELKRFNSEGSKPWEPNTEFTIRKRKMHNTWPGAGKLMMETGYLRDTLSVTEGSMIKPAIVSTNASYAGVHNNPEEIPNATYGNTGVPVTKRQFMGHSSYIDTFIIEYQTQYLFDSVFLSPA